MTYKLTPEKLDAFGANHGVVCIIRKADNAFIPVDPENTNYQEYLEWLKIDGNEPDPAD
jgi:hypothetical protein